MKAVLDPGLRDRLGTSIHPLNFKPSRKHTTNRGRCTYDQTQQVCAPKQCCHASLQVMIIWITTLY